MDITTKIQAIQDAVSEAILEAVSGDDAEEMGTALVILRMSVMAAAGATLAGVPNASLHYFTNALLEAKCGAEAHVAAKAALNKMMGGEA